MAIKKKLRSKFVRIGICFSLAALSTIQLAAQANVPNVFASGTPAKAAEVNENFTALNNKIESISAPEKGFSVLSSETLDSGLVRTKLYAYEAGSTYTAKVSEVDNVYTNVGSEIFLNALGKFRGEYIYTIDYANGYTDVDLINRRISNRLPFLAGVCPDGSEIERKGQNMLYTLTLTNDRGAFVMSNQGAINSSGDAITGDASKAGVYYGCAEKVEYYYLEGLGAGIYSCISRVAYYGAFTADTGLWDKVYAPVARIKPYTVVGIFDATTNGVWGTYYLEIDAPADCLNLD